MSNDSFFREENLEVIKIRFASDAETEAFGSVMQEELEFRIGKRVSAAVTPDQLKEFDMCETNEESRSWIEKYCPSYKEIVREEKQKLSKELVAYRDRIAGNIHPGIRNKAMKTQHDASIENEQKRSKEPFDFEKFVKHYFHDRGNCQSLSPNESPYVIAQYERRYYDHPEIMTVVDFANYLNEMDSYS